MGDIHNCYRIADTYIEEYFREVCLKTELGEKLWSDWIYNKDQYVKRTKTTIYEFMNYSRHDASHSVNILMAIGRILGEERVRQLSLGDLWLLLNAAYAHDIGMSTEYWELQDLWKDPQFLEFIDKERDSCNKDTARAAKHYGYIDAFVKKQRGHSDTNLDNKFDFEWDDYDSWSLQFRKEITSLMAEYVRKRHGSRSEEFFKRRNTSGNILLSPRLNGLLGRIVALHTEEQEKIQEISLIDNGFSSDDVHPQFIAVLLRVGDLLDLDNNRFDIFSMKHFGTLPRVSVAHYKKHQSVTHFYICPEKIEVTAKSDDFEVCKINLMWFDSLKDEITNLITHWKEIAPVELTGCRMGLPELLVMHKNRHFSNDSARNFILNTPKMLDLFTGNNLYDSTIVFIREYIQNAFDADRIQMWLDLDIESKRKMYLRTQNLEKTELKPIDFTKAAYDNYPVDVRIKECRDEKGNLIEERFVLEIEDTGIGMDKEGVEAITNIGSGWRTRPQFNAVINRMRQWFRPTGGFGIGMQSAFMVTDKVQIDTKSPGNPAYRITMIQAEQPNNILVEYGQQKSTDGTCIHLEIDFSKFDTDEILSNYGGESDNKNDLMDAFDYETRLEIIYNIITNYIQEQFVNSLFPIHIHLYRRNHHKVEIVQSIYFFKESNGKKEMPDYEDYNQIISKKTQGSEEKGFLADIMRKAQDRDASYKNIYLNFDADKQVLRMWDDGTEAFYHIKLCEKGKSIFGANYKNVSVTKNCKRYGGEAWNYRPYITDVMFDVMGTKVRKSVLVSRDQFKEKALNDTFNINKYVMFYFEILFQVMRCLGKQIPMDCFLEILLICQERLSAEELEKYRAVLETVAYNVWEMQEDENGFQWKKNVLNANNILKELSENIRTVAIVANEKLINYSVDNIENGDALNKFYKSILVIDNPKTESILHYYMSSDSSITIKRMQDVIMDKAASFKALTILNPHAECFKNVGGSMILNTENASGNSMSLIDKVNDRTYEIVSKITAGLEPLVVQRIPFRKKDKENRYIINPYNKTIGNELNRFLAKGKNQCNDSISSQEFVDLVMSDSSFKQVCKWVYEHQIEKEKYNEDDIKKAYKQLILCDFHDLFLS